MPEIAEVRTVAKALKGKIIGKTIKSIDTPYSNIIKSDLLEFKNIISNKKINDITTNGKWLIFNLGDYSILSHLRMEGKYFIKDSNEEINKHEHIIFHLDDGLDLRYHDTRKFGVMMLVKTDGVNNVPEINKLGIEPDSDLLTVEYLFNKIHKSSKEIKVLLLDQTIINGLGNIYVDEVLFTSSIHPSRKGNTITKKEVSKIIDACMDIIPKATLAGGTTIRSYTSSLNVKGTYQTNLRIHTKDGEVCPRCQSITKKIRVGGRGTYICDNCQK